MITDRDLHGMRLHAVESEPQDKIEDVLKYVRKWTKNNPQWMVTDVDISLQYDEFGDAVYTTFITYAAQGEGI